MMHILPEGNRDSGLIILQLFIQRSLRELFPDVPVVIGGIEASMRRLTHYDYWKDKLEPSILLSSGADMLIYGMGEQPVRELLRLLSKGVPFSSLKTIPQTVIIQEKRMIRFRIKNWKDITLNSYEKCLADKNVCREFCEF